MYEKAKDKKKFENKMFLKNIKLDEKIKTKYICFDTKGKWDIFAQRLSGLIGEKLKPNNMLNTGETSRANRLILYGKKTLGK